MSAPDKLDCPSRTTELLAMSLAEATRARWEDGRARYGDDWSARHPLVEAYLEVVDLRNYLREAERQGAIDAWLLRRFMVAINPLARELLWHARVAVAEVDDA